MENLMCGIRGTVWHLGGGEVWGGELKRGAGEALNFGQVAAERITSDS